jgi:cell division protein FtsZ
MKGARGVLINITGGYDMTLYEVDAAANEIRAEVDPSANIILGSTFDDNMEGRVRVSVVACGIDDEHLVHQQTVVPQARRAGEGFSIPAGQRKTLAPAPEAAREGRLPHDDPRPQFRPETPEPVAAEERKRGGLFGWLRGNEPRDEPPPRIEAPDQAAPQAAADDDLEIPAFLRRQIHPR